jgi:hypothetical protein
MKENPKTHLEAESLDKNRDTLDDFLLKTIKFNDIKEIKSQLPSTKNYNGKNKSGLNLKKKTFIQANNNTKLNNPKANNTINNQYQQKLKNVEKEKENIKKELVKQIEYGKLIKRKKENRKKVSRAGNRIQENNDNLLKHHQTVVYKKNNAPIPTTEKRDYQYKSQHPEIDISNNNKSTKIIIGINSERRKQTDLSDLYLKKYGVKLNKALLNSKLSEASILKKDNNYNYESDKADTLNNLNFNLIKEDDLINNDKCFTSVQRPKKMNLPKEDLEESETRNTINSNMSNNVIYNKKNVHSHIKKINIDLERKNLNDRRQSATPVYKKTPMLNPILCKSIDKDHNNKIIFPSNKLKKLEKIKSPQNNHKINQFYSYGINITSPSTSYLNNNHTDNEIEQILITEKDKIKNYAKKINMKSQITEREKDKQTKLAKKRSNLLNDNTHENQSAITVNNSNTYLRNINSPKKIIGKCYMSPKCNNNSQVFNNFYSINMGGNLNLPFKVINVYKK